VDQHIRIGPATLTVLQPLDQAGLDQQPIEAPRFGAVGAQEEPSLAAFEDFLLFGKSRIERQPGGFLDDQRQIGRFQRVERR